MKKKPNLSKFLPVILIAGAAYAVYTYFRGKQQAPELMPPAPPALPPAGSSPAPPSSTTPAPPAMKPVQIGAKALATTKAAAGTSAGMTTLYSSGGTDEAGNIEANKYAGTVIQVNDLYKTAQLVNYTYPMKDSAGKVYTTYWMMLKTLKGA